MINHPDAVWNIYLHLPHKWPSFVGKYTSTMVRIWVMKHGSKQQRLQASLRTEGRPGLAESFDLPMHLTKQSRAADSGARCQALISSQPGETKERQRLLPPWRWTCTLYHYMQSQGSFRKSRSAEQFLKWKWGQVWRFFRNGAGAGAHWEVRYWIQRM